MVLIITICVEITKFWLVLIVLVWASMCLVFSWSLTVVSLIVFLIRILLISLRGLPGNLLKLPQQLERVGQDRDSQATSVTLHWPGKIGNI